MAVIYRNLIIGPKHRLRFAARKLNGAIPAVLFLDLASFDKRLCLTKGHAVRTDTFAGKIKSLPHVWQFHAPAMVLAGWSAAVEGCSTFITNQLIHVRPRALDKKPALCQTIMQALRYRCRPGPAEPDTIFLSLSGKAVLSLYRCEHGGIGRHTRLKILRPYGRGGSSPPARTSRTCDR